MPRLAWFTPWPPQTSGVAGRSVDAIAQLAARGHGVDVFVDERDVPTPARAADAPPHPGAVRVQSAHDFVWRQGRGQYDLIVYQVGNSRTHEFLWPYLFRWPGLVVLHDARLHHARSRALLRRKRADAYRAELRDSEPSLGAAAAELAVAGFDGPYYYAWPMLAAVVRSARLVAAHTRGGVDAARAAWPSARAEYVALGEGRATPVPDAERRAFRQACGFADDAVVFGVAGGLTANKRVLRILDAFAAVRARVPGARLLLAGTPDPLLDLPARIEAFDLGGAVHLAAHLSDRDFDVAVAACDVSLHLRWPSSLEMSGPWLRALAASRATIVTDLEHLATLPMLDPRTWTLHAPAADRSPDADRRAIAVAIDILDEDHSLQVAMLRLATDAGLRADLGRAARHHWEAAHTIARMADDYERVIAAAMAAPIPTTRLPPHLRPDPAAHVRDVLALMGDDVASAALAAVDPARAGSAGAGDSDSTDGAAGLQTGGHHS